MSEYTRMLRKRGRNLLIVEGEHEKNKLFWLLFRCFPEINIDMEDIWIYGTNIYLLYEDIVKEYGNEWIDKEDDIDLPFVISKKQHPELLCYKEEFVNIIMVFDYERHDVNFSEKKILEMQGYFRDAADVGKLYINYPMIESYQHLERIPDNNFADRKISVLLQPGSKYKNLVRKETSISKIVEFPHKIKGILNEHYGITDNDLCEECYEAVLNISDECFLEDNIQNILQGKIDNKKLQTAKYQIKNLIIESGYAHDGQTYWEFVRGIFQKIIFYNICKANRIQNNQYQIEDNKYRSYFEQIDLYKILVKQNKLSEDSEEGFIWVLNTCIFFVPEYNFKLAVN